MTDAAKASAYLRRLPIGERLSVEALLDDELFPFEGEITTRPLDPPLLPEPSRRGESAADCGACGGDAGEDVIWEDERWWVLMDREPHAIPAVAVLMPKAHHDLEDLPAEFAEGLGPMIQRLSRAIARIDSVGRVHVNRWGDGSLHFHLWFLARPRGMWQMRGAMLAVWDDLLPKVPREEWDANRRTVAEALGPGNPALSRSP